MRSQRQPSWVASPRPSPSTVYPLAVRNQATLSISVLASRLGPSLSAGGDQMTTEQDFQDALDRNPDDWQTRMVFADFLQDRDDPRAEGYRAMGLNRLSPRYAKNDRLRDFGYWVWSSTVTGRPHGCVLKESWHLKLEKVWVDPPPGWHISWAGWRAHYPSRREADDAAAIGFAQLNSARRDELLSISPC